MRKVKGSALPDGRIQIACTFDRVTFERLVAEALKEERSVAQLIRLYVKKGLGE